MASVIRGLKRIKQLTRKIESNKNRVAKWCSYIDDEEPLYTNIDGLVQSICDMQTEIANIRHAMHKLNANKVVQFQGKDTTIDQMLLEATVTLPAKLEVLKSLRRKEKGYGHQKDPGLKVVLQYDPVKRDKDIDNLIERQNDINDAIDILNIETELVI